MHSCAAAIGDPAKQVDDGIGTGIRRQRDIEGRVAIKHGMGPVEELMAIGTVSIYVEGEDIDFRQSCQKVALVAGRNPRRGFLAACERGLRDKPEIGPCITGRDYTCQLVKRTDRQPAHNRVGEAEARIARFGIHAEKGCNCCSSLTRHEFLLHRVRLS